MTLYNLEELKKISGKFPLEVLKYLNISYKKVGDKILVKCPFHKDKSFGSALVFTHKKTSFFSFVCYSCQGDEAMGIIDFVSKIKNLSLPEASELLFNLYKDLIDDPRDLLMSEEDVKSKNQNLKKIASCPITSEEFNLLDLKGFSGAAYSILGGEEASLQNTDASLSEMAYTLKDEGYVKESLKTKPVNFDIRKNYSDDFALFFEIVKERITYKKKCLEGTIKILENSSCEQGFGTCLKLKEILSKIETIELKLIRE